MTDEQRAWFGPGGGSAGSDFGLFAAESDACVAWNADDPASGLQLCARRASGLPYAAISYAARK
mgnify:CR=1 FL=1